MNASSMDADSLRARTAVDSILDYLNDFATERRNREFVDLMLSEHRTLQQSFTRLCLVWLWTLARQERYDERNEESVRVARAIVATLGPQVPYLPVI